MSDKVEAPEVKNARPYDVAPPEQFTEFMRSGWAPSNLEGLQPLEVVTYAFTRRQVLSEGFPNIRLVIPSGNYKTRSNDTEYVYRPHSPPVRRSLSGVKERGKIMDHGRQGIGGGADGALDRGAMPILE